MLEDCFPYSMYFLRLPSRSESDDIFVCFADKNYFCIHEVKLCTKGADFVALFLMTFCCNLFHLLQKVLLNFYVFR